MKHRLPLWVVLVIGAAAPAARAVIPIEMPASKLYASAVRVMVGTISAVDSQRRLLDVQVVQMAKGDSPGAKVRVQIVQPEQLVARIAAGQPIVIFEGRNGPGAVHVADTWLTTRPVENANPPAWKAVDEADLKRSFPGRTAALAKLVMDMKAGKSTLLDWANDVVFTGGVHLVGKTGIMKASGTCAADVNGDGRPDLLIVAPDGLHLLLNTGGAFTEVTEAWGLKGIPASAAALADLAGDGRPELICGGVVYLNKGGRFERHTKLEMPPGEILAIGTGDINGDGRIDIIVFLKTNQVVVFQNPGAPDKPWAAATWRGVNSAPAPAPIAAAFGNFGDDGRTHLLVVREHSITRHAIGSTESADFVRLTGEKLAAYDKGGEGFVGAAMTTIDINGDGRRDVLLVTPTHGLMLINRGFGAFFPTLRPIEALRGPAGKKAPFALGGKMAWTSVDWRGDKHEDLMVLNEDGQLYRVANPPAEE